MMAIPICLLPHTVLLKKAVQHSVWGSTASGDSVLLTRVRIEGERRRRRSGTTDSGVADATMYYDWRNSRPQGVTFAVGDVIVFNGREYAVDAVEWLCGKNGAPHHAEIRLI